MRKLIAPFIVLALLLPLAAFGAPPRTGQLAGTDKRRYLDGEIVTITLTNSTNTPLVMGDTWHITDLRDDQEQSQYVWPEDERTVDPGEQRVWRWEQNQGCYGICQNVKYGEPSGPGHYQVVIPTEVGPLAIQFDIGQYFTIGFDSEPGTTFVVWVNTPDEVAQMEKEAASKDKTLIVSGIVKGARSYNAPWKISMGPGSIVLGEAFIEVCDGSAKYVQRHRQDWKGERWCPWSSYVEKVGR
ncbi:MAG: hypothetical protein QOG54_98 [Actinomycetota bacterium]|jgi:hypothetical protein|nr:hypothetical protein [Actinomycetota bacterium]